MTRPFHVPNPEKGQPDVLLSATFSISGPGVVTRKSCLEGFGAGGDQAKSETEQMGKANVSAADGDDGRFVQGWEGGGRWNRFGVEFGQAAFPIEIV
jgi:hypothetical protein